MPGLAGTGYKVAAAFLLISKCSFPVSLRTCVPFMAAVPFAHIFYANDREQPCCNYLVTTGIFVHFRGGQECVFVIYLANMRGRCFTWEVDGMIPSLPGGMKGMLGYSQEYQRQWIDVPREKGRICIRDFQPEYGKISADSSPRCVRACRTRSVMKTPFFSRAFRTDRRGPATLPREPLL